MAFQPAHKNLKGAEYLPLRDVFIGRLAHQALFLIEKGTSNSLRGNVLQSRISETTL